MIILLINLPVYNKFISASHPWPTVLNHQTFQMQQNIFHAVGNKDLKELALFASPQPDGQVSYFSKELF